MRGDDNKSDGAEGDGRDEWSLDDKFDDDDDFEEVAADDLRTLARGVPIPGHVAIIMDGNGRWAKKRLLPRVMGHRAGLRNLEKLTRTCHELGVRQLTVFAFSSENWRRPPAEVKLLMKLLLKMLDEKVATIHESGGRILFLGSRDGIPEPIAKRMDEAEIMTRDNPGMRLNVAVNYGGRWDVVTAVKRMLADGLVDPDRITEEALASRLCLSDEPEPDLLIRTGGEMRVSNFMLWQLAYTEYYFTDTHWPDFDTRELLKAFSSFGKRERRFGRTSEQLLESKGSPSAE